MADTFSYRFLVTAPGGGEVRDLTALVQSLTWTGDVRQTARGLTCTLAVPRDGSVEIPPLEEGAWLTLEAEGTARFFGTLLQCTTSSQSVTVNLSALDRGRFLVGNEGYYNFSNTTPEAAAALICRDFQIPTAGLAATGIPLNRNFPGKTLDAILRTLARSGKALEINTSGLRQPYGMCLPHEPIVRRFKELGGEYISLGSDAHSVQDVGKNLSDGAALAKLCGFDKITYYVARKPHFIEI